MYPTINSWETGATANPLHVPYPSAGGASTSSPSQPPAPPQPQRANGPPAAPAPAFPTLQVAIDPRFCLAPPVLAPSQPPGEGGPAAGAAPPPPPGHPAPGSSEPLDLALERRLVEELKAGASGGSSGGASSSKPGDKLQASSGGMARDDPYEALLKRYTGMGYSRDEVAMGLAIVGPEQQDSSDKIVDAVRKFKSLSSMGFRSDQVVGALLMHGGDEQAATETLLDASAS